VKLGESINHGAMGSVARGLQRVKPKTEEGATIARGAGAAFLLQVAGAAFAYLMQLLFARWLGAEAFGTYTYTIGWSAILAVIAGLGLSTAVVRFIPAYSSESEWARLRGLLRMAILATALAGTGIAVLGTALLFAVGGSDLGLDQNALLGMWMVPLFALLTLQQEIARAFRRIGLAYAPSLVGRPALAIAGGAVCLSLAGSLDSTTALIVTMTAMILSVAAQGVGLWGKLHAPIRETAPAYETRHWLKTSLPLLFIASFIVVLMQTDVVMVGAIAGDEAAGLYGAAAKTASLVGLVLIAANAIAAPVFSSLFAAERHDDIQRLASQLAHYVFWPSLLISLVLAALAKPVLSLFGGAFVAAHWQLTVLLVGQVVSAGAGAVGWLMLLTGHQNQAAWVYGWVALIHVVLLAVAIPLFGPLGAAIATTASYSLWNIWLSKLVVRNLAVHPSIFYSFRSEHQPERDSRSE
jgi:O-antigen/teichoic acid export membrane protein